MHDGVRTLKFRVANERKSHIVGAQMRLWLVSETMTAEGERYRQSVELVLERSESPVFSLTWTLMHRVDEHSPLSAFLNALDNPEIADRWHLLVTFTGYHENLANQVYARHIYLPDHVQQNATFVDTVKVLSNGKRVIDLTNFEKWIPSIN
jgi:inward rectifier potassium channel